MSVKCKATTGKLRDELTADSLISHQWLAKLMIERKTEVPIQLREPVVIGIDNAEKALALFFDNAFKSTSSNSAESVALIKRVIAVKMAYARKIARANDLTEATALQFAYCRSQIEVTTDLIRFKQLRMPPTFLRGFDILSATGPVEYELLNESAPPPLSTPCAALQITAGESAP